MLLLICLSAHTPTLAPASIQPPATCLTPRRPAAADRFWQHPHTALRWQTEEVSVPDRGQGPAGHQRAPAPIWAMQAEVALQRGLLGLEEGEVVNHAWVDDPTNCGRLLRHAVHTTKEMEAAMAAWQLDMVPWEQSQPTNLLTRPPRPRSPYALTPTSKCCARHIFIDTRGLYGLMHDASMLGVLTEQGVTCLDKFRNGALPDPANPGHYIEGPKNSKVASRWDALLPDPRRQKLASPKHRFAQTVETDGVAISVMFLRPKPAAPPAKLPRMAKGMEAVNPLANHSCKAKSGHANVISSRPEQLTAMLFSPAAVTLRCWPPRLLPGVGLTLPPNWQAPQNKTSKHTYAKIWRCATPLARPLCPGLPG
ncbi:hypothetical protein HaLaN_17596 [Haematococcus lacustris]|uniref:Uncharacterized protein n=1 Tax=Haematococcus lacustris TaxID=44745 RepID=A0A699ZLK6_HAELA|nr:hypothetical protein HaLaN_17596 [Haematococcus lacustris]